MNNFIAYHNVEKMGYPFEEFKFFTNNRVSVSDGQAVWVISGEGASPKSYYLTSLFIVAGYKEGSYAKPDFANEIRGVTGQLWGKKHPIMGDTLDMLLEDSLNLQKGFYKTDNALLIDEFRKLIS